MNRKFVGFLARNSIHQVVLVMSLKEARKLAERIIRAATSAEGEGVDLDDVMDLCEWVLEPKRKK